MSGISTTIQINRSSRSDTFTNQVMTCQSVWQTTGWISIASIAWRWHWSLLGEFYALCATYIHTFVMTPLCLLVALIRITTCVPEEFTLGSHLSSSWFNRFHWNESDPRACSIVVECLCVDCLCPWLTDWMIEWLTEVAPSFIMLIVSFTLRMLVFVARMAGPCGLEIDIMAVKQLFPSYSLSFIFLSIYI